jgi:voltage-gated potassium channel
MKKQTPPDIHWIQGFYEMLKKDRYRFLLYSILLLLGIPPFLRDTRFSVLFFFIFLTVLLIACMNFLSRYRRFVIFTFLFFFLTFISGWLSYITDTENIAIARSIFVLTFFTIVLYNVLNEIRCSEVVNSNVVFGSIAAYLLLGIIGGNIFSFLDIVYPGSFNIRMNLHTANFFSFTTLTTVGYGSIYPVRPQAQSIASLFAMAGQLYLTILVAIIVGKYLLHSENRRK